MSGGAKEDGTAVGADEFAEGFDAGAEKIGREHLGFIENNDAARDVMEFATGGGTRGEKGLEELNVGGDDERGVPIFGGEVGPGVFPLRIDVTMMLEHGASAKSLAEDISVLLDDGGVGDDVDDAP